MEVGATLCFKSGYPESHSAWFKWTVESSGSLGFTLLPLDESDDIDFVLYQLQGDLNQCKNRQELRCLVYGPLLGQAKMLSQACTGATGLKEGAPLAASGIGCPNDADNFLSSLEVESGASYLLFINNFRSTNGFLLEFSGSCTFKEIPGLCSTSQAPVVNNFQDEQISISEVMPNPATDGAQVILNVPTAISGQISIVDLQGRIRETRPLSLASGENVLVLDVAQLEPGVYFAKIQLANQSYLTRFYKH